MQALVYHGPRDVRIDAVPDAMIERSTDALVRILRTNICGSDLHMYEGRTDLEPGTVIGHEPLGEVIDVGEAVQGLQVGDLVCLPFNVSCGYCANCTRGYTGFCLNANPGNAGAAYGYSGMGPYRGGQAEYLQVPWADFNALKLPEDARDKLDDYVMLSDIFPTGYHSTELACVEPGDSVVVYGAGPVGLMAGYSAMLRGASRVFLVDRHPDRLKLAEAIGLIAIDDSQGSPVEQVLELTGGLGADKGCECVGWQAHDPGGHEHPNMTLNNLVESVRATGSLGVVGVFPEKDPKSPDKLMKEGQVAFDLGKFFEKGLRMGTGQTNVKCYNQKLCALIEQNRARPSFIVSHVLPLEDAVEAYRHFDARDMGWTKVVMDPWAKQALQGPAVRLLGNREKAAPGVNRKPQPSRSRRKERATA